MQDVVIVGAGVSGCAIARELSRFALDILVLEKEEDVCCGTSKANSGIVHAGFDAPAGSLMAKLNVAGSKAMEALSKELDFPYRRNGSLVLMTRPDQRDALEALMENGRKNGVEGLEILDRDALLAMEPHLSEEVLAGLYAPTGAIVCPFGLTIALAENAAANGVKFQFDSPVTGLSRTGDFWTVHTPTGMIQTRTVMNAAGVHAGDIHSFATGENMKIIPRRGEYFLMDHAVGDYVNSTVFQLPGPYGKGVLVTPTVHGNLLVGPTATDQKDPDRTATTREGLDSIREKAAHSVTDIPWRQTITSFAGLRAHRPEHEFYIRETLPGYIDCAGIESPGLTSAPAVGELVAKIAESILKPEKKANFCPSRKNILNPNILSPEARSALIERNPAYGRIICRCEGITEGEILDAIHRTPGARSLDGVKRRVRAGMGRCQGGFCSPKVTAILARELGISLTEVTKSGGSSVLLTGRDKEVQP